MRKLKHLFLLKSALASFPELLGFVKSPSDFPFVPHSSTIWLLCDSPLPSRLNEVSGKDNSPGVGGDGSKQTLGVLRSTNLPVDWCQSIWYGQTFTDRRHRRWWQRPEKQKADSGALARRDHSTWASHALLAINSVQHATSPSVPPSYFSSITLYR